MTAPGEGEEVESVDPVIDSTEAPAPVAPTRHGHRALIEWLIILVIALTASLVLRGYVIQTFSIPSGSMEPTLMPGDRILVSKLSVRFGTIHRGDIVVFHAPPAERGRCEGNTPILVKRVIGLPGDHLTSRGNTIYVNGAPLKETWTHIEPLGPPIGNVTVPANSYFMMGDNHPYSCDSRTWGVVPRSDLIGKAFFRIWPPSRIGFL